MLGKIELSFGKINFDVKDGGVTNYLYPHAGSLLDIPTLPVVSKPAVMHEILKTLSKEHNLNYNFAITERIGNFVITLQVYDNTSSSTYAITNKVAKQEVFLYNGRLVVVIYDDDPTVVRLFASKETVVSEDTDPKRTVDGIIDEIMRRFPNKF